MPQQPVAMATGGGNRQNDPDEFEDFVSEIQDIEQGREGEDKEEEDASKTPDEGEQELAWLKDVGYGGFVSSIQEGKEINEDQLSSQTSSLTKAQSEAVKKRVDTLNATIRKKQRPHAKKDVRDLFTQEGDPPSSAGAPPPNYKNMHVGHRSSHNRPQRHGSKKMREGSILKNRGGYSMTGESRADKDSQASSDSPDQLDGGSGEHATEQLSCIETLSIQTRETSRLLLPGMPQPSVPIGQEIAFNVKMEDIRKSPRLSRTQEVRSSMTELPNFVLTQDVLGVARVEDMCDDDMNRIRSLALIELTTLFDCYNISYTRRKPGKRKQKEHGVYGMPLQTLLDHDRKLFPQLKLKVPFFYKQLMVYLENNAIKEEGILRVPGSALRIRQLRQEVEDKLNAGLFSWDDVRPNDAAGLLKQFLRELPSPLLSFEYLDAFAQVESIPDKKRLLQALNLLVLLLPDVHRESLMLLLHFLTLIVDHIENRMTLNNVAMIMAPNLFLVQSGSNRNKSLKELDFTLAAGTANIIRMLVKYQDLLCTIPTYLITQVRSQYEHDQLRKSKSIMKFLGRKDKSDVYKKPPIQREEDYKEQVIRVQTPHLSSPNTAIRLDDQTTADHILARLQSPAPQTQSHGQVEGREQHVNGRDTSSNGSANRRSKCDFILCEVGGNIGDRKLPGDTNMLALYRVNPNADWIIRKPD